MFCWKKYRYHEHGLFCSLHFQKPTLFYGTTGLYVVHVNVIWAAGARVSPSVACLVPLYRPLVFTHHAIMALNELNKYVWDVLRAAYEFTRPLKLKVWVGSERKASTSLIDYTFALLGNSDQLVFLLCTIRGIHMQWGVFCGVSCL